MPSQILHIDSSLFGEQGVSSQLSHYLKEKLLAREPEAEVVHRSLANEGIAHFNMDTISKIGEGKAELADQYIKEVQEADVLIVSAPMYNFAVPTQLKSWFDHIARAGTTFRYTENGPEGLLKNKKAYVVTTRGGIHKNQATDTESSWLKTILAFVGITEVEFIYAEALNMRGHKESSIAKAQAIIDDLTTEEEEAA